MQHVIDKHYRRLANDYDEYLYYSPEFVRCLTAKMIEKLRLDEDDRLVDLGCGTGMYSLDILRQVPLRHAVLGVDPYEEMLAQIPADAPITRIAADALEFSSQEESYNKVLIKETIHHVDRKDELFSNLYRKLPDDGVLLLVHVPPQVRYPLFEAALKRCESWHADPLALVQLLERSGFAVDRDAVDYEHAIPKEHYFRMVQACYMSVLTSFEPDEIQRGLAEMDEKYADVPVLQFVDHFDCLTATKA